MSALTSLTPGQTIPETTIHDILRNDRRRAVIEYLQNNYPRVTLRTLSENIAETETGISPPPKNIQNSVYVSLHQTHLPKLHESKVVEYDADRKTIELRSSAKEVDAYMTVSTKYGPTWATYYRSLATVALLAILGAELGAPVVADVGVLLLTSLFLFAVALSGVYQLWNRRWLLLKRIL